MRDGGVTSLLTPVIVMPLPPGLLHVYRNSPPGRRSFLHSDIVHPYGPIQFGMCLQLVCASNTSLRGASKVRVTTTSVSAGVVNVVTCLFAAGIFPPFPGFELCEIEVESLVALVPEFPEIAGPLGHILERRCLEPARAPLCIPAPRDQTRPLQHTQVLRDRGTAHREWLGELLHRRFSRCQSREDGATRRIGEGGEGDAELIGVRVVHCI